LSRSDDLNFAQEAGTKTSSLAGFLQRRKNGIARLHETLFSLNIAFAFVYALLLYVFSNQDAWTPVNDSTYYFSRSAYRLNDLLRIGSRSAVETNSVARHFQHPWNQVGYEFLVVVTTLSLAALIFLVTRFLAPSKVRRLLLDGVAGATALFAVPLFYLCVSRLVWSWPTSYYQRPLPSSGFWRNPRLAVFVGEVLCFAMLLAIDKKRRISIWIAGVLLLAHYSFWTFVLWPNTRIYFYWLYAPRVLFLAFPAAGIVWLLYLEVERTGHSVTWGREEATNPKFTIAAAALGLATLVLVWMPSRGVSLAHIKDLQSLRIEMSRGPCFGSCPVYAITIHGDGVVDYVGRRDVGLKGSAVATIGHQQLIDILQGLDRAHFSTLEDRAFSWCFDSPSVAVSVSADGRTMRAGSDASCTGAKSGMQSQFVKSTSEIDAIVGSSQWVGCNHAPCQR
jgi:uncharacterized protein DUF6438